MDLREGPAEGTDEGDTVGTRQPFRAAPREAGDGGQAGTDFSGNYRLEAGSVAFYR